MPNDLNGPWSDMECRFVLQNVRVVATFEHDGGAIVELVERLECIEGRRYEVAGRTEDDSRIHLLSYRLEYGIPDVPAALAAESAEARVIITGTHTNGKRVEVRGHGWLGYDNEGNLEGHFERPPVMITEETDFPREPNDDEEMTEEEFRRHMATEYPMPKQYQDALLRVPSRSGWDDD